MNFQEFIDKTLGKAIDTDGFPKEQPYQCVDLPKYFNMLYNGDFQVYCSSTGYAKDWANNKYTNGLLDYFDETAIDNMITGTLVVWGNCKVAPYSHIGFFIKDNGNGTFRCLQQNAPCPYVTISNISYEGIIGAFIPKQLLRKPQPDSKTADQILYPKSKVRFYGTQIDYIDKRTDTFTSNFYTGNGRKNYHLIPLRPFYRIDENGNWYENQIVSVGNWVKNDEIYTVKAITSDSAKVNVDGKDVWIFSRALEEISDE